ncbi:MAG: DUF481 domain-containing protein [Candidatus Marinimicrobia bacterium]|jgi:hypothetical protein|nr:DUF481 domain-containing protein [Candidatus Neomarinimicrobiota bacterium]MBT3496511.1 DUF481 domain-containing protein [Candidatus Neomarinimicrobiota bacterium]MBT3691916.1 DUF481 domain-containing protein [Candidatus Neomarinimicrobiota bacterium]MBT3732053.1 DUF481 domain-containing protein [Candidatus Neomarinimicrobiota bacterium]MBT4144225.1 DUF481 domain-containing protein [Candidatus Neomarinimicrobiota bacterium]
MNRIFFILLSFSFLCAHTTNQDSLPNWKYYSQLSVVQDLESQSGLGFYFRVKRVNGNQFNDFRLFGNYLNNDSYLYLRHKSSHIFSSYNKFYRFITVSYEQNTLADLNVRYHYNNGFGYFIQKNNQGNITSELGIAYDMSDYLNASWKTSYIKYAFTWDAKFSKIESKMELEYFSQISDINESDLSRFQGLGELQFHIWENVSFFVTFIQELDKNTQYNRGATTISYSIGWEKPLKGKYFK